jgi:hypothetical protein
VDGKTSGTGGSEGGALVGASSIGTDGGETGDLLDREVGGKE